MAKVVVLGAGLMGRALAYDFCRQENISSVEVSDISSSRLKDAEGTISSPKARYETLDITNKKGLMKLLDGAKLAVGATSYQFNAMLTEACIQQGAHFLDLGGNDSVVDSQFKMHEEAKKKGVTIIPDCGLAPGLAGILGMHVFRQFDSCESIHLRVGGLPQNPQPPLNYMIVFSVHGLINEYKEPVRIIENGKQKIVPGMSGLEKITFPDPLGELEAFYTSGGVSTLVKTLDGKLKNLDYKTIRYRGHQEKIVFMQEMGFFDEKKTRFGPTPREVTEEILFHKLNIRDKDLILIRVWGEGKIGKEKVRLSYQCMDYFDSGNNLSSMMRSTAFPAAIVANMILLGRIQDRGVLHQELVVPVPELLKELAKRDVKFTEEKIPMSS